MSSIRPAVGKPIGLWTVKKRAKNPNDDHVWFVEDTAGREGVLKWWPEERTRSGKRTYPSKRFRREVRGMRKLADDPGVLPLLDSDPRRGKLEWMVTERAVLLAKHYGTTPDLREVVAGFHNLATSLERIATTHDIAHRDLKPANLFWLNGQALLGDFGIARWPKADPNEETLTNVDGGKLGSWGFLSPEALETRTNINWYAADVYSLAKCLWAIAAGKKYPIQGALFIREEAASLWKHGGKSALGLSRLLELATAHRPHDRPTMRQVRDELGIWLTQNPIGSTSRPDAYANFPEYVFLATDAGGPVEIGANALVELLSSLRSMRASDSEVNDADSDVLKVDIAATLGIGDPEWAAEWIATKCLTWPSEPDIRIVAQAFSDHPADAYYLAQWQTRNQATDKWAPASPVRHRHTLMRLPSDRAERLELTKELAADDPKP